MDYSVFCREDAAEETCVASSLNHNPNNNQLFLTAAITHSLLVSCPKPILLQGGQPTHIGQHLLFVFLYSFTFFQKCPNWLQNNSFTFKKPDNSSSGWQRLAFFSCDSSVFYRPGDLCEIVPLMFSHWNVISWSRYAEHVHVWYCLVHLMFSKWES